MASIKSNSKISLKLTKKTKDCLDWDSRKCSKSTVKRIMKATEDENYSSY